MRKVAAIIVSLMVSSIFAATELSIGEYASQVRSRVISKINEALKGDGKQAEVSGVVTYSGKGCFFIQKDEDGLKIISTKGTNPKVGDEVLVFGSPSLEGGRVVFEANKWTKIGCGEVPSAREVSADELVNADDISRSVNWLRVTVMGRAIGITENGFAVKVDGVPINVMMADVPSVLNDCDHTHPKVKITGVAELMLDQSSLLNHDGYIIGVKLDVSKSDDVELIPDMKYLAAKKEKTFVLVVASLMVVLAVAIIMFGIVIFRQRKGMFRTKTIMAERKRMAEDIHDTIEQHLVGAGMLLKINRLKEAQDVLVRAKREIRDIVWGLQNDDMMRLSPAEMLRKLAHDENVKGIYRVDTKLDGLPEQMNAAEMRDLSLIVRETIGNAVKHGGAKRIAISSEALQKGGWLIRISNDGAQFDPDTAPGAKEGHFGIGGMKQRARRIGADLSIACRGKGMVLNLEKRI